MAASPAQSAHPVAAVLGVDQTHPVFFDHPLDHVPGMLMAVGMLDSIREAMRSESIGLLDTGDPGQRLHAAFTFKRLAEVDAQLRILTVRGAGAWEAQVWQDDLIVATATVEHLAEPGPAARQDSSAWRPAVDPLPAAPVRAELVNRTRPENVLLGTPVRDEPLVRTALLAPPPGHYFAQCGGRARSVEEIAEGGRQVCELLWRTDYGRTSDVQLLLESMELDLPLSVPRADAAELRWRQAEPRGNRAVHAMDVCVPARSQTPVGTMVFRTRAATLAAYQRLRAGQQHVAS